MGRRRAYTLIELAVVILLMGLIMALVGQRFSGLVSVARLEAALPSIRTMDQRVRSHARRFGRDAYLVIDLDQNKLWTHQPDDDGTPRLKLVLGNSLDMKRVVTASRRAEYGRLEILVSADGISESYGIQIRDRHNRQLWIVVSGVSGQAYETEDEEEFLAIFRTLAAARLDVN